MTEPVGSIPHSGSNYYSWTTTDEVYFIKTLGFHTHHVHTLPGRVDLLASYLRSCTRRDDWNRIDRTVAETCAKAELQKLSASLPGHLTIKGGETTL